VLNNRAIPYLKSNGITSQRGRARFCRAVTVELEVTNARHAGVGDVDAEQHHCAGLVLLARRIEAEHAMHAWPVTNIGAVGGALDTHHVERQAELPHERPEPAVDLRQLCRLPGRISTDLCRPVRFAISWRRLAMHGSRHQETQGARNQR
jgi:hypothetical protein